MSAFFTYIFKHQHYKDVIADYNEAITKYSHAYKIWLEHEGAKEVDNFGFKETVASNLQEIKRINTWIQISTTILNTKKLFKFDSIKFLWQPNQSFLQRPLLILHNCVKGDGTNQAMRKFSRLPI